MGKLHYLYTTSLDGYVCDENGDFSWGMPSDEVHTFVNDTLSNVGTVLMGRKLYEVMKVWDDIPTEGVGGIMDGPSQAMNDYAKLWHAAKKTVYSTTLDSVSSPDATLEHSFDPVAVQKMVDESDKDTDIGGAHLAGEAIKANIIDNYHQIIVPILIGGGTNWLPQDVKHKLELVETRTFENGFVYIHYKKVG